MIESTVTVDLGKGFWAKWRSDRSMVELFKGHKSIILVEEQDLTKMLELFNEGRALEEIRSRLKRS